jgi:hypothetical protein
MKLVAVADKGSFEACALAVANLAGLLSRANRDRVW